MHVLGFNHAINGVDLTIATNVTSEMLVAQLGCICLKYVNNRDLHLTVEMGLAKKVLR